MITGKELKQIRRELGLTQKGLAEQLGVSLPTVVNWELSKATPRGKNLQKLNDFVEEATADDSVVTEEMLDALQVVTDELGFEDIQEMLKNLIRRHKLGLLDL